MENELAEIPTILGELKSLLIQKPFQTKRATSTVARVASPTEATADRESVGSNPPTVSVFCFRSFVGSDSYRRANGS